MKSTGWCAADSVNPKLRATPPCQSRAADILDVAMCAGFRSGSFIIDVFNGKIVGWSASSTQRKKRISMRTRRMAGWAVGPKFEGFGDIVDCAKGHRSVSALAETQGASFKTALN